MPNTRDPSFRSLTPDPFKWKADAPPSDPKTGLTKVMPEDVVPVTVPLSNGMAIGQLRTQAKAAKAARRN
jgi:hypothetical protein